MSTPTPSPTLVPFPPTSHSYATLFAAIQSTLTTGLLTNKFHNGVFIPSLTKPSSTTNNTAIDTLQTLTSSPFLSEAEKTKFRPLLSTLILLGPTEFFNTTRTTTAAAAVAHYSIHAKLTSSILGPDGMPGPVLKAVQTLFEDDARKRGMFDISTPRLTITTMKETTTVPATESKETDEVHFVDVVRTAMNVMVVVPPGNVNARVKASGVVNGYGARKGNNDEDETKMHV